MKLFITIGYFIIALGCYAFGWFMGHSYDKRQQEKQVADLKAQKLAEVKAKRHERYLAKKTKLANMPEMPTITSINLDENQ